MSQHINLIYDSEQRSASLISALFVVRLIGVLIPFALLLFLALAYMQSRQLRNSLAWAEDDWKAMEPRYQAALQLQRDIVRIREVETEIERWRRARHGWGGMLWTFPEIVPPDIQLTQLQSEERLQLDGNVPVRLFTLKLWGRARGRAPDADVEALRNMMVDHSALAGVVKNAVIPRGTFGADPTPGADRAHRVFQLNVELAPRRFE